MLHAELTAEIQKELNSELNRLRSGQRSKDSENAKAYEQVKMTRRSHSKYTSTLRSTSKYTLKSSKYFEVEVLRSTSFDTRPTAMAPFSCTRTPTSLICTVLLQQWVILHRSPSPLSLTSLPHLSPSSHSLTSLPHLSPSPPRTQVLQQWVQTNVGNGTAPPAADAAPTDGPRTFSIGGRSILPSLGAGNGTLPGDFLNVSNIVRFPSGVPINLLPLLLRASRTAELTRDDVTMLKVWVWGGRWRPCAHLTRLVHITTFHVLRCVVCPPCYPPRCPI